MFGNYVDRIHGRRIKGRRVGGARMFLQVGILNSQDALLVCCGGYVERQDEDNKEGKVPGNEDGNRDGDALPEPVGVRVQKVAGYEEG